MDNLIEVAHAWQNTELLMPRLVLGMLGILTLLCWVGVVVWIIRERR